MPHNASGDVSLPRVDRLHPAVATATIGRTLAEVYKTVIEEPLPPRLMAIVQRMEGPGRLR